MTVRGDQDGTEIRRRREAQGLMIGQFATQIDIHPASLTNIERGRKAASLDVLVRIADALDVPLLPIVRPGSVLHTALTRDEGRKVAA